MIVGALAYALSRCWESNRHRAFVAALEL